MNGMRSVQIRAGDYLQMLEYTESEDEHSTLCGTDEQSNPTASEEVSEGTDCLSLLQAQAWHRESRTGLPPPGNGVFWESKCLDALDDLLHGQDGDYVVDFPVVSRIRPVATPARSRALPKVISLHDELINKQKPELQIHLGLSMSEIDQLMDLDPVAEQLEVLFDVSTLDDQIQQQFRAAPTCVPDTWNPAESQAVRIYTDGSYIDGSATWSFVVIACYQDRTALWDTSRAQFHCKDMWIVCWTRMALRFVQNKHALIWATWWLLRYWRLADVHTPIVFLWDSQVAGRQAEGLYGTSTALGRLLRGIQIALQQLTPEDVGHLHVPAHCGHLYNEVADTLAKQAHAKRPACPDQGLLLQCSFTLVC